MLNNGKKIFHICRGVLPLVFMFFSSFFDISFCDSGDSGEVKKVKPVLDADAVYNRRISGLGIKNEVSVSGTGTGTDIDIEKMFFQKGLRLNVDINHYKTLFLGLKLVSLCVVTFMPDSCGIGLSVIGGCFHYNQEFDGELIKDNYKTYERFHKKGNRIIPGEVKIILFVLRFLIYIFLGI